MPLPDNYREAITTNAKRFIEQAGVDAVLSLGPPTKLADDLIERVKDDPEVLATLLANRKEIDQIMAGLLGMM